MRVTSGAAHRAPPQNIEVYAAAEQALQVDLHIKHVAAAVAITP